MPNDHEHAVCGEVTQDRMRSLLRQQVGNGDKGVSITWGGNPDVPAHAALKAMESLAALLTAEVERQKELVQKLHELEGEVERVRAETVEACAKVAANGADLHRRSFVKDWRDGYETACNYIAHAICHLGPDRRK